MTGGGLTPLEDVQAAIFGACPPMEPASLDLATALGCVTAEAVMAAHDVPTFANTAMDGFAVRATDTAAAPVTLRVVGTVAAGSAPECRVGPGEAVRIMTGAPIPLGADAVVMVERTRLADGGMAVTIEAAVAEGTNIRRAGEDLHAGQNAIEAGTILGPAHLGVLASVGLSSVRVSPPARVGVLSTGDELVAAPAPLGVGQIRDSNRPVLLAMLRQAGCEPVDLGLVADDESAIVERVETGVRGCDAMLVSGGVSVGDFDYVKPALERAGEMRSWQVAVRPSKPLAFGIVRGRPVFGLPGNPVSSMVSFELFVRPALRQMMGHRNLMRPEVEAVADEGLSRRPDGKLHLVRVVAGHGDDGRWHVRSAGGQGSHVLSAMASANALALLPDSDGVHAGETVTVMILSQP